MSYTILLKLDPLDRFLRILRNHIKVKSGDLSIKHDHIVMLRRKLSSDWLNTHVTKRVSLDSLVAI